MKTTTRFAALTLGLTLGTGIVTAPLAARASEEGKRNTALALGAAAVALLLTQKNKTPGVVVAGAAVIAASQLGHERWGHYRHDDYRYDDHRHDDHYGYNDNHYNDNRYNDNHGYGGDHGYNTGYDNRSHDEYRSDNHGGYNTGGYRVGQNGPNGPNRYDDTDSRAARPRTARAFGGTR